MRAGLMLLALGCSRGPTTESGVPAAEGSQLTLGVSAAQVAAHGELFAAADAHDLSRFRRLWSPATRQLLERYFRAVGTLERTPGAPPVDWQTFMDAHADLPAGARSRTPYRLVGQPPLLDLGQRPEAQFFQDVTRALAPEENHP